MKYHHLKVAIITKVAIIAGIIILILFAAIGKINAQRIYQVVLTKHMEVEIDKWMIPKMEKWGYQQASPVLPVFRYKYSLLNTW